MAYIQQTKSGWRAQVERRGKRTSRTFRDRASAETWASTLESRILEKAKKSEARSGYVLASIIPRRVLEAAKAVPFKQDELIESAIEWGGKSGVYFLIRDEEVKYVGQSVDVLRRIARHIDNGFKFDSFNVIFLPPEKLSEVEERYISALVPPWNVGLGADPERIKLSAEMAAA